MSDLYKHECGLYVHHARRWQIARYGYDVMSKWDCISNTMRKIIDEEDRSEWAYEALRICRDILIWRYRWPLALVCEEDVNTRLFKWSNKLLWYLSHKKTEYGWIWRKIVFVGFMSYGPRNQMTRDPYDYFFTACVEMDRKEWIEEVTIPWYLYRRKTWRWRRFLITGKGYKKDYVIKLDYYRAMAAMNIKNRLR